MVSMRNFGGGGALEPLSHDHREHKLATSCLRTTHELEEKGRLFFLIRMEIDIFEITYPAEQSGNAP